MKKFIALSCSLSSYAFAGGIIGGNPGLALEMSDTAFSVQSLPKTYVNEDEYRRAVARLGELGASSANLTTVDGEKIQVRKLRDSVVDEKILKEILPNQ